MKRSKYEIEVSACKAAVTAAREDIIEQVMAWWRWHGSTNTPHPSRARLLDDACAALDEAEKKLLRLGRKRLTPG